MSDPEREISFDDILRAEEAPKEGRSPFYKKLLRYSAWVAGISFLASLIGSVVGNNAAGDRDIESIAFLVNRYGAFVMLLGCVGVLIALRAPQLSGFYKRMSKTGASRWSTWWRLLWMSLAGVIAILLVMATALFAMPYWGRYVLQFAVTVSLSLMLVIAVWHQGPVRAFAIGVIASVILSIPMHLTTWSMLYFSSGVPGYSPYSTYGNLIDYYSTIASTTMVSLALQLLVSAVSGLVCAAYVTLITPSLNERDSQLSGTHTTLP